MDTIKMARTRMDNMMKMDIGPAMVCFVAEYGKHDRAYTVTFNDNGKWEMSVKSFDGGGVVARFKQD